MVKLRAIPKLRYRATIPGETLPSMFIFTYGTFHTPFGSEYFGILRFAPLRIIRKATDEVGLILELINQTVDKAEQLESKIQGKVNIAQAKTILSGGDFTVELGRLDKQLSEKEKIAAQEMIKVAKEQLQRIGITNGSNKNLLEHFDIIMAKKGPNFLSARIFGQHTLILFFKSSPNDRFEDYIKPKGKLSLLIKTFGVCALQITPLPQISFRFDKITRTFSSVYIVLPVKLEPTIAEKIADSGAKLGLVLDNVAHLYQICKNMEWSFIGLKQEHKLLRSLLDRREGQLTKLRYDYVAEINRSAMMLPKNMQMALLNPTVQVAEKKDITPYLVLGICAVLSALVFAGASRLAEISTFIAPALFFAGIASIIVLAAWMIKKWVVKK